MGKCPGRKAQGTLATLVIKKTNTYSWKRGVEEDTKYKAGNKQRKLSKMKTKLLKIGLKAKRIRTKTIERTHSIEIVTSYRY